MLKIDFNGNLKWNSDNTLWQSARRTARSFKDSLRCRAEPGDLEVSLSQSMFDVASFIHLWHGFITYKLGNHYINNPIKTIMIISVIHCIEDFLENITINGHNYSIEHIFSKILNCNNPAFLDSQDHDSLNNFIGDNISFILGSLIGMYSDKTIRLKISHIWLILIIGLLVMGGICKFIKFRCKTKNLSTSTKNLPLNNNFVYKT